jgi:Sortase domain
VVPAVTAPVTSGLPKGTHEVAVSMVTCEPTRIVSSDIGLDRPVYKSSTADFWKNGTVDPQYYNAVMWGWTTGGVPGSANAAYLYGHHAGGGMDAAFNVLNEKNVQVGDHFTIYGNGCELQYVVEASESVLKDTDLAKEDGLYMGSLYKRGYVVLTTCDPTKGTYVAEDGMVHAKNNFVVVLAPVPVNTASAG